MRRSEVFERLAYWAGIVILGWAIITFLFTPLVASLRTAFMQDGAFAIGEIARELGDSRRVRTAIWNTIWMTAATTLTATILGLFQVVVLEYFYVRGRTILKIAFAVPLIFGSIVAAAGYNFTYGPNGIVTFALRYILPDLSSDWFIGWIGVLFIHTFLYTGFFFLFVRAAMRRVNYSMIEAARSLGASEFTILRRVVFPSILPTMLAVILLTIYGALGSFAAPQILGGRDFYMLSQLILTLNSLRRQDMAAFLAIVMGAVVMILILLSQHFEARGGWHGVSQSPTPIQLRRIRNRIASTAIHCVCYCIAALYFIPVFVVVLFSFAPAASIGVEILPSKFTLANYTRVFTERAAFEPAFNSARMGIIAIGVGMTVTIFSVQVILKKPGWLSRLLDLSLFLPWVVPSILLAVGLIVAFDTPNLLLGGGVLLGSFWILPIAYTVVILPLMVRFLRAAFIEIDSSYEEAARSLGASGMYRFRRIILPIILPTIILVGGLTFNDLMTEYPLSAFLYNVHNRPLPIAIFDGAISPDPEQKAINLVYSVLVMGFSLAVILFAERISLGRAPVVN